METNIEYTNFFEEVVRHLAQVNEHLIETTKVISKTELVKKPTKKALIGQIDTMLQYSDFVWNKLAALGKIK